MSVSGSAKAGSSTGTGSTKEEITDENVRHIHEILEVEGNLDSPIDINLSHTTPIPLPDLVWHHLELIPKKMKITNSGHTVIISAKWHQERPFVSGGPFVGNYVFSQLHFHWGKDNMEGSEHTIDGTKLPMEMHVVYFRSSYLTQEAALRKKDGVSVMVYFFKLQGFDNPAIQTIIDELENIQKPHSSIKLLPPLPLAYIFKAFWKDYFLYWGSVTTQSCVHSILWLLSREVVGISMEQMETFRTLLDINEEPLLRNYRSCTDVQKNTSYHLYHVSPSTNLYSTLLYVPQEEPMKKTDKMSSVQSYRCDKVITHSPFMVRSQRVRSKPAPSGSYSESKTHSKSIGSTRIYQVSCFDTVSLDSLLQTPIDTSTINNNVFIYKHKQE